MRKHLLTVLPAALLLAVMLLTAAAVSAETSGDYEYSLEDGRATVTGYTGTDSVLTVPSSLGGCPVTAVGESAFAGCYDLVSVTLSEGITDIGDSAFFNCTALTSVTLPESLVRVNADAFCGCTALEAITLPKNVAALTGNPFSGCASLTAITVASGNSALEVRNGLLYNRAGPVLACWPQGLAAGVCTVPDGTAAIGTGAFFLCEDVTAVVLPDSVTAVGDDAFRYCLGMTSVRLPAGITALGRSAFEGCGNLTEITLPQGITAIEPWLLRDCDSLTAVTVPEGVRSIGMDAFEGCDSLARVILPRGLTDVGIFAFYGCDSLTDVYFRGSREQWNAVSVDDLNDPLTEAALHVPAPRAADADLPEDLAVIESQAFRDLVADTLVRLPASLAEIADDAFPSAEGENSVAFIAPPGSYAEAWGLAHGYTVWFDAP